MLDHEREEKIKRLRSQATSLFSQRYNIYSVRGNEAQIVENKLHRFSDIYTEEKTFNLFVGTWNVNAKSPPSDLSRWLSPGHRVSKSSSTPINVDIYALGFQEIVDLNAANLVVDHSATKPWESKIEEFLGNEYELLTSRHLVGLSLVIYVRKNLIAHITDVMDEKCGVGIMGVGANKGALAVRFNINDYSICFVNSHLAAHQHNVKGRNEDFHNICQRVQFKSRSDPDQRTFSLLDHNEVFWMGDLNYRINLTLEQAYQLIEHGDHKTLAKHDQLTVERHSKNVFSQFTEGELTFDPTYKYIPGTKDYDRRPDKKRRIPAWCDRVLWLGTPEIRQVFYRAENSLCISDHMPVCSLFELRRIRIESIELKQRVREEMTKGLEDYIATFNPSLDVYPEEIDFGDIAFDVRQVKQLYIANTGRVDTQCEISVLKDTNSTDVTFNKDLVSVWPKSKTVKVLSATHILVELRITSAHSFAIACAGGQFCRTIKIKIPGTEKTVIIKGNYLKSCFGVPLSWLVNCHGPVRTTNPMATKSNDNNALPVPKELWRILNAITTHGSGLRTKNLFGDEHYDSETYFQEVATLRECLDRGLAFPSQNNYSIHALTQLLTGFLQALTEPVYPASLANRLNTMNLPLHDFCHYALLLLPPAHYNVFVYIIAFLREILRFSQDNNVTEDTVVQMFAAPLMHPSNTTTSTDKRDAMLHSDNRDRSTQQDTTSLKTVLGNCETILRHYITSHDFNA